MKIYKYEVEFGDKWVLQLPLYSTVISAQNQNEKLYVWAKLDYPDLMKEPHLLRLFITGKLYDLNMDTAEKLRFIDTVQFGNGAFVVHVFEER